MARDVEHSTSYLTYGRLGKALPARRFYIWTLVGADSVEAALPAAGGRVDGITAEPYPATPGQTGHGHPRVPGMAFLVEAGAAISGGQQLATDAAGRAVPVSGGATPVALALSAATAGSLAIAVFL